MVDNLETTLTSLSTRLTSSYSIADRSNTLARMDDVRRQLVFYRAEYKREIMKQRAINGQPTGNNVLVRFRKITGRDCSQLFRRYLQIMALLKPSTWFKKEPKKARLRHYAGAQTNRLLADWFGNSSSANREIKPALVTLRNRSRELARNHWIAVRALQIYRTQVIGDKGLSLQVRARNLPQGEEVVGPLDRSGNQIIEDNWKDWTRRGTVEVTGAHSWIDCQKLAIESLIRDGEILIHIVKGADNKFGFALQLLEADFLDESLNKDLKNGRRIVMGVEIDQYSRPVAYHLYKGPNHPYGAAEYYRTDRHTRIPADNIIHLYHPERAQQTRGVPLFASVLNKIQMLDGYEEAELVASRLAASKSLF